MALSSCCITRLKAIVCIALFIALPCISMGQKKAAGNRTARSVEENMKLIADSLNKTAEKLPIEKVYLHTNKAFYNIGDTIWFKAYLLNNVTHTASTISNRLYLTMMDDSLNVIDRISIRIKDGVGWAQMPIRKIQYQEGYYTLWATTVWMQNFNFFSSQRFYFSPAAADAWLVTSNTAIDSTDHQNKLNVALWFNRTDRNLSPVALKDVEVKIFDRDHYLFKKEMRTGVDGSLKFSENLRNRVNGKRIRAQITSLDPIDTNKIIQVPLLVNRSQKIDLQFLPEGSKLVTGLKSLVGFKAIGEDGRGMFVSGGIFDSRGNKVANFKALHNGMGSFELTPGGDLANGSQPAPNNKRVETYTARVTEPGGITEEFPLPKVEPAGTVIHISNPEKSDNLKITLAGLNSLPADSGFCIIGTSAGKIYFSQKIDVNQTELNVDKRLFPTGIAQFTLFKGLMPLNERAVFIDHQDQLQVSIKTHKSHYGKRDSVSAEIEVKDKNGFPVEGSFSLSVTDDLQTRVDSVGDFNLSTSLLLTGKLKIESKDKRGDITMEDFKENLDKEQVQLTDNQTTPPEDKVKTDLADKSKVALLNDFMKHVVQGEIESPGYYISRPDAKAWEALDNLMLTQAWTDYDWLTVFRREKLIDNKPENTYDITGTVLNAFGKPVVNSPVLMISQKPALSWQALTDKKGVFTFKNLLKIDTGYYFFQALKANGKLMGAGEIVIDRPDLIARWPFFNYPIMPWYVNADNSTINQAKLIAQMTTPFHPTNAGTILREVKIKQRKVIKGSWNPYGEGNADYIFDENDIKRSGLTNLYDFLMQNIPFLRASYIHTMPPVAYFTYNHTAVSTKMDFNAIAIDDIKTEDDRRVDIIEELSKFNLSNIRGIELIFSNKYTQGRTAAMAITTYKGNSVTKRFNTIGANSYRPIPVTAAKAFYSPKYQLKPTTATPLPDYRPAIYWEPNIFTDKNGKATVSFYTSDSEAGLSFNIQGVSIDGQLGSLLYRLPNKR